MEPHVRDDLSAYLDNALAPAERALVKGHLDRCAACQAAVGELRAAAGVIAAMPLPTPSRRLVPSLAPRFAWARPARSLSAVLSGVFILVFIASATLDTGWRMGGGRAGTGSAARTAVQPAREAGATAATGRAAPAAAASPNVMAQEATRSQGVAGPAATAGTRADSAPVADTARSPEPLRIGPSPWLWLGLALLSGVLAFAAHRRLRAH